jgi:DNA-binding transcriptional ArsR family regulator
MSLDDPPDPLGTLSDARTLRALTHPVRIALLEALTLGGALTATQAAEQIGESPTTCSFHLRQLARYGFVEEAGGGKGRARPWRISSIGWNIATGGDPEAEVAASVLLRLIRGRQTERYQAWLQTKSSYPREWQEQSIDGQWLFYLTAAEMQELGTELYNMLLPRFAERADPARRPPGTVPVELLVFAYPIELPQAAGEARDGSGQ